MILAKDKNYKEGYLNRNGETVIPFGKYHGFSHCFNNGFAIVIDDKLGHIYIDKQGNILELKF